ncbi:cytochrome P450 [Laetiporus sulphureus 93-53]|uniref:Cytochrome P450 n=1 Tax=Laetiporus sulphureus 93-53 TaxID=1314785 RepID=A0A165DTM1_9APHY|nr:cytochrome P450 [Laetiporus sulphureus 93-53]KZT05609.1 cytochrome P450 [Laetiporus sulphureus 93-53]
MQTPFLVVIALFALWVVKTYVEWRKVKDSLRNYPGLRYLIGYASWLIAGRIPYLAAGNMSGWRQKHQDFVDFDSDIISSIRVLPKPGASLLLADAEAIKAVTSDRTRFPKPLAQYKILTFFGSNIVVTEADEWKRHRKISAPSFSERNNRLVWDESMNIVKELSEVVWLGKDEVAIDNIVDLTVPMALFVIGVAGFGRRMSWIEDFTVPAGHAMPFKAGIDALHIVSNDLWLKVVLPSWLLKWGPIERIRRFRTAYDDLERYMIEMIRARKTQEKKEERYDLFSSLLDANEDESDGTIKLSDSELMGNIFIYLIAGHETTAHTLAYTFIMLALHQEEQETLYQHIQSVVPEDVIPSYEEMGKLTYPMAVFLETLRMFPPVNAIPKKSAEDTTLVTRNMAGEPRTVPCPAGMGLVIHTPGLHYNPRYWEDPFTFKPSRFLAPDWPRDAFLPFSGGARSCLGRRFSETEGVAILTYMIKHFRVDVRDEPQFAHETFQQRKARLLNSKAAITLYPVKAPLVFKRR